MGVQGFGAGAAVGAGGEVAQAGLGPLLPIILAITAAVAGIIAVGSLLIEIFSNTGPEANLKKTQKAYEGLQSAAEDAANEASNLKSVIESYDSA